MPRKNPWLVFLLPFVVFMIVGSLEPTPDKPGGAAIGLAIPYSLYPAVYTIKIALTLAAVVFVLPGYKEFPFRVSLLAVVVGVVGALIWVGLCKLDLEHAYIQPFLDKLKLGWLVGSGERAAFDPLRQLADRPVWAWVFLGIRFFGLALVVPLVEEFFLRGFVMRFVVDQRWWEAPFGQVNRLAVVLGTLLPMFSHPGELLAAAVWFSLVTWLMVRTRNIWDCVAAHLITNLLLGVYVVATGDWRLM
jgi:CAAX prenyl protease-like protein